MKQFKGSILLLITAMIWGSAFVAQRAGMEYIGPFTFNGIRSIVGFLVLIPVILMLDAQREKENKAKGILKLTEAEKQAQKKTLLIGGLSCGVILFIASSLQQFGMVY
ncbi:MAG: DMT family transporter, partial [Clostridia bacterium]|nr:DMT family transporter [Clostridia bacterium]